MSQLYSIPLLFNAKAAPNCIVSPDGSTMTVTLDDHLGIPFEAKNVTLKVLSSSVWWVTFNIKENVNDDFKISGPNNTDGKVQTQTLTVSPGLYDISSLQNTLSILMENANFKTDGEDVIQLGANNSTQRVTIRFPYPTSAIDLSIPTAPNELLGWASAVYGPYNTAPETKDGTSEAKFNTISSFLIKSDIVDNGILHNGKYTGIINEIKITVPPGSQQNQTEIIPMPISAQGLAGSTRKTFQFQLCDQDENPVDTAGESWSVRFVIEYTL